METKSSLKYSILVTYRQREEGIQRVKNCISSLADQSISDFEIIFYDDGSSFSHSAKLRAYLKDFSFLKYYYRDSRGQFWNRAQALNLAFTKSSGKVLLISDIDLIYPPNFLDWVAQTFEPGHFLLFPFYMLPEWKEDYKMIIQQATSLIPKSYKVPKEVMGNIILERSFFQQIGGFDPFYRFWGVEDRDFVARLEAEAAQLIYTEPPEPVFHQWHPRSETQLPKNWLNRMQGYFDKKEQSFKEGSFSKINFLEQESLLPARPLGAHLWPKMKDSHLEEASDFSFVFPLEESYLLFYKRFRALETGDYLYVDQDFPSFRGNEKSRLGFLIKKLNLFFEKISFSYRFVDLKNYRETWIQSQEVHDFLFYFVLEEEANLSDYFIEKKGDCIQAYFRKSTGYPDE